MLDIKKILTQIRNAFDGFISGHNMGKGKKKINEFEDQYKFQTKTQIEKRTKKKKQNPRTVG